MKGERRRGGYLYSGEVMIASLTLEAKEGNLRFIERRWAASQQKGWLRLGQNGPNAGIKAAPREDAKAAFQRGERKS